MGKQAKSKKPRNEVSRAKASSPKSLLGVIKTLVDSGVSIAFDQYLGLYQATIYPDKKDNPINHCHFEGKSLEEVIEAARRHINRQDKQSITPSKL